MYGRFLGGLLRFRGHKITCAFGAFRHLFAHFRARFLSRNILWIVFNLQPPGLMLKPGWRGWFTGWESACGRPHSERVAERIFGITSRNDFSTPFSSSPHLIQRRRSGFFPILDEQFISIHSQRTARKQREKERTSERQSSRVSSTAVQNTWKVSYVHGA